MQIGHEKWRRRFRPDDQSGRASLIVLRRHAERCQRVERLREVVERPRAGIENGNIRLHQGRAVGGRQRRGLYQLAGMESDGRRQRRGEQDLAARVRHQEGGCDRGIHQHNLEGDSVHAGHRGDTREWNVVDLRGAQQVPGKSGDVGARQFDGDPHERREDQRAQAESIAARGNEREQKPKQPVI